MKKIAVHNVCIILCMMMFAGCQNDFNHGEICEGWGYVEVEDFSECGEFRWFKGEDNESYYCQGKFSDLSKVAKTKVVKLTNYCREGDYCLEEEGCVSKCADIKTICGDGGDECCDNSGFCVIGECKKHQCEVQVCNGNSDQPIDTCNLEEAPTCDGNSVKKCTESGYITEDCGDDAVCTDGKCISYECDDNTEATCDGILRKYCKDRFFATEDCNDKLCIDGVCSDESFNKECEDTDAPKCDDEANASLTCTDGKWVSTACNDSTCVDGECVSRKECDPTEDNISVCAIENDRNGIKVCNNDSKYIFTPCDKNQTCIGGLCINTSIEDLCPDDAAKTAPGTCGCGIPDSDYDKNGTIDCLEGGDLCPDDSKELPGICGCGIPDTPNSENPICLGSDKDLCPDDPYKTLPGICGCGLPDTLNELTRQPVCIVKDSGKFLDLCPDNADKVLPGTCGCEVLDTIDEVTGVPACGIDDRDLCPDDENKMQPGVCGCGVEEFDADKDGIPDCIDQCPENPYNSMKDNCECNKVRVRLDRKELCAIPIKTAAEFVEFMKDSSSKDETFALIEDINLYDYFKTTTVSDWKGLTGYSGNFVSTGKTISFKNNKDKRGSLKCTSANCGLFSTMSNARVHNINFDLDMKGTDDYVGVLAGQTENTNITYVNVMGNVEGAGQYVGGLVGYINEGKISSIAQEGNVSGFRNVGGVIGYVVRNLTLSNVTSEGSVTGQQGVGGVVGRMDGSMTNVTNKASVTAHNPSNDYGAYAGGIAGKATGGYDFINIHNSGDVSCSRCDSCEAEKSCAYVGGVFGALGNSDKGSNVTNCSNSGTITTIAPYAGGIAGECYNSNFSNISNSGDITASGYTGGIVGLYHYRNTANKKDSYTWKNLINTGNVLSENEPYIVGNIGGIVGMMNNFNPHTYDNMVNSGNITGSKSVGGLIGLYRPSGNDTFMNLYSTGNIVSTEEVMGGLIGYLNFNEYLEFESCQPRDFTVNIDKAYAKGSLNGKNHVGGLIGFVATMAYNRERHEEPIQCQINNQTYKDVCVTYKNCDYTNTISIRNAYFEGEIKAEAYAGGIIGYADGHSSEHKEDVSHYNNLTKSYDDNCKIINKIETSEAFKGVDKLILSNVYSAGIINGKGSVGALIGYFLYSNLLYPYENWIFNNVYSTMESEAITPFYTASDPSAVNLENAYCYENAIVSNHLPLKPFNYDANGAAILNNTNTLLVNQLNNNITNSHDEILNKDNSETWIERDIEGGNLLVTIPSFGFKPIDWQEQLEANPDL